MEYVELKTQIEENERQMQALKAALQAKRQEALSDFAEDIKADAETLGFKLSDIIDLLKPIKPQSKPRKLAAVYVNPDNADQTYTKGPKPAWLKARMAEFGIDPTDKQAMALLKDIERAPVFSGEVIDESLSEAA